MRVAFYRRPDEARRAIRGAHGWLGFAIGLLLNLAMPVASPAQTFSILASFGGADGETPLASVIQGANGDFYGTTIEGGSDSQCYYGCGTIFKVKPSGKLSALYSFCTQTNCPDGMAPYGGLLLAPNGDFYGTTQVGGANSAGTVFKITAAGTLTTLHSFCSVTGSNGDCLDGIEPWSSLVIGKNDVFYGTTQFGGANGRGTVFKITAAGVLTTLYSFCSLPNCADGSEPESPLLLGTDGNLYGTTTTDGAHGNGGTVFKLTPAGKLTTLHSFCSKINGLGYCTDGATPYAGLVQATDGNFYGTTYSGGANNVGGTVFKMTSSGKLTTLYSFCAQPSCADGADPEYAALIQASDGNFYGTTTEGGAYADGTLGGTVFKITPTGEETVLHSFCANPSCTDGNNPTASVVQGTDGDFYGTTSGDFGTVFKLSTGLGPFVATVPGSAGVGAVVTILGTNLTGATSVTFNGTAATITAISVTDIKTTVPAGATTGVVEVTTPSGTLKSNAVFTVIP